MLEDFGLFFAPPRLTAPAIERDKDGNVAVSAAAGVEIRYWLDSWPSGSGSKRYTAPIPFAGGGVVKAVAIPPDDGDFVRLGGSLFSQAEFGLATCAWSAQGKGVDSHPPQAAIDEDSATYWESEHSPGEEALTLDLGDSRRITGFIYLPVQDMPKGRIVSYAWQVSADGTAWGDPAVEGGFDNIENNPNQRVIRLETPVECRYVRLNAREVLHGVSYATAAEVGVLAEARPGDNEAAPPQHDKSAYWNADRVDVFPQRSTEEYPLSDQENAGGWERFEGMSDEFEGNKLDAAKWWGHNPGWRGRQPALFYPGNVEVRDGQLLLSMRKEEAPDMPEGYHTYTSARCAKQETGALWLFRGESSGHEQRRLEFLLVLRWRPGVVDRDRRLRDRRQSGGQGIQSPHHPTRHAHPPRRTPLERGRRSTKHPRRSRKATTSMVSSGMRPSLNTTSTVHLSGVDPTPIGISRFTLNFDSETMPDWFGLPKDEDLPSTYRIEYVRCWKRI